MKIELTGYNLGELIKTLHRKKFTLTNLCQTDAMHLSFEIADSESKRINRFIANYKIKKSLTKIKLLPHLALANLGVIVGVFLCVIFAIFASNYVWQIRIYGNENISTQEIMSVLADNGIKKGKLNTKTNQQIEEILLNNYNRLAQVSVIRQGSAIIVNLSEKLVYNPQDYPPITAHYSGIITNINVLTGTVNVKVGDYVNAGDILVLPFNLDSAGNKIPVQPYAEIAAKMYIKAQVELPKITYALVRTGKSKKIYNYSLFSKQLFSKNKNSFDFFEIEEYNTYISSLIPIKQTTLTYFELKRVEVEHNFETEKQQVIDKAYNEAVSKLPPNHTLIDEQSTTSIVDGTLYATTIITVDGIIS